jgi:hypothetical protein
MTFVGPLGKTRLAILFAYSGGIAMMQMIVGEPRNLAWWLGFIPFFLWTVAPIGVPLATRGSGWFVTMGVGLLAVVSFYIYGKAMLGSDPSSTAALIFIFLPLYLWMGVAYVFLIDWLSRVGEHNGD